MVTRQDIRERRRKKRQQQQLTTILIVVGVVLILAAILMMPNIRELLTPVGEFEQPELNTRPMADANRMGDPNAPVELQIFSDFGCGHCAIFAVTTGEILTEKYVETGQVYMVYNTVGNLLGHPSSLLTAEAAYCAGDQNLFWEYHDILYANQTELFANINKKLDKTLSAYAESLGMDINEFENCRKSNRYNDTIQEDLLEANQANISSTPSFLVNGKLLVGNVPLNNFESMIQAELENANLTP
jgi:protein-disulfide isomerase